MNKKISKVISGMLVLAMTASLLPSTVFAEKATNGKTNAVTLGPNETIKYNTATLYNYSTAFDGHNEGLIAGKSNYNADLMKKVYEEDPEAELWKGIYFTNGTTNQETIGFNKIESSNIGQLSGNLFDGDIKTKAWTTWRSSTGVRESIQLSADEEQKVSQIVLYFSTADSDGDALPSGISVENSGVQIFNRTSLSTNVFSGEGDYRSYTISFNSAVSAKDLNFTFTNRNSYNRNRYMVLTEVELLDENGEKINIAKEYEEYNYWSGHTIHDRPDRRGYIYSGLVMPTLVNGQILFSEDVPEAGLFTSETSNKEVYPNVQLPFVYDSATGYYDFDASKYGIHFDDANSNGIVDQTEKNEDAYLVLDAQFRNGGFYPFNCTGPDKNAEEAKIYHFGMNTAIPFTMTADGTVDGNGGEPITFEFAGDDDVWVYIDGQLVLDLGGVHDSVSGKIDFKENAITMWATNQSQESGDLNKEGVSAKAGEKINLGQILNSESGTGTITKSYETFAGEGEHILSIFYLERGQGESNCRIRYNLPTQDALEVTKNIKLAENESEQITDEEWSALNALEFKMRVLDAKGEPVTGKYALYDSAAYKSTEETDADGYFTLKNNQKARFVGTLGTNYTVEEVATEEKLPAAVWKSADWNGTFTSEEVVNLPGKRVSNDATDETDKLTYEISKINSGSDVVDTLAVTCTNYISRPFVSVAGETVVIDYGLPVLIDIMKNDVQSAGKAFVIHTLSTPEQGTVKVVDKDRNQVNSEVYTNVQGYYYLEYTPNTYMDEIEKITYTYKVQSSELGENKFEYPTGAATVIPATSMYYEEDFLNASGENYIRFSEASGFTEFTKEGTTVKKYQEPGVVGTLNDSTYGTDVAYLIGNGDSNGTSYKADTTKGPAAFQYIFTGTGTAFFARTSEKSGYLRIKITDSTGKSIFEGKGGDANGNIYIDTKYAVEKAELFNIPVYNIEGLPYGTYTVTVTVAKPSQWYDTQNEFYLDGVRVYSPLDLSKTENAEAVKAYEIDLEADTKVKTLRAYMLDTQVEETTGEKVWTGESKVMFTDSNGEITTASEYESNGPKQELYMTDQQTISFVLKDWFDNRPINAKLYIGAKIPDGQEGSFTVNNTTYNVKNATDCYYDITNAINAVENTHNGIVKITVNNSLISFTNLKCTGFAQFELAGMNDVVESQEGNVTVYSLLRANLESDTAPTEPEGGNGGDESTENASIVDVIVNWVNDVVSTVKDFFGKWFKK